LLNAAWRPDLWPVIGRVTSSFGERLDPFNGEGGFHAGLDIATAYGSGVRASADGVVIFCGLQNGYGRTVIVDHGHGIRTLYAHLAGFATTVGDHVLRGDLIGFVGRSGRTTGSHLHYEVRINNAPVNPHKYLRG
jgi:murein DD-endopeptidase MepM/ murein hydrolase activator NlpD